MLLLYSPSSFCFHRKQATPVCRQGLSLQPLPWCWTGASAVCMCVCVRECACTRMHVHVWCWGKGALLFVTESVLLFFSPRRQRPAAYGWAGLGSAFRISTCPLPWHSHPANEYPSPFSELSPSLLPALLRNYTLACLKSSFSGLAKYPGFLLRPVS